LIALGNESKRQKEMQQSYSTENKIKEQHCSFKPKVLKKKPSYLIKRTSEDDSKKKEIERMSKWEQLYVMANEKPKALTERK